MWNGSAPERAAERARRGAARTWARGRPAVHKSNCRASLVDLRTGDRPSAAAVLAAPVVRAAHDRCAGAAGSAEAGRRQGRHFVALVKVAKDYLWLDGKRSAPVGAGPRSKKGAKRELRKLVDAVLDARPDAVFSVVALVDTAPRPRPRPPAGSAPRPRTSARRGAAAPVPPPAPLATRLSLWRTRSGDSQDAPGAERPRRSKMYRK